MRLFAFCLIIKNSMKRKLLICMLIAAPLWTFAQSDTTKKSLRKMRPAYINVAFGLNFSNLRDFATSPLTYSGRPLFVGIDYLKTDQKRETEMGVSYSFGKYTATVGENSAVSQVKVISGFYSRLYEIPAWGNEKWNIKAGGLLNVTGNIRSNASFQNNAFGSEIISTVFGSVKATRDVSRTKHKDKKFLFIKYKLHPRKKNLAFRLNLGLMNNTYRNGYVYSGQSSVINKPKFFDEYQFSVFSGFRMGTSIDYTISLKSSNAIRFSYVWDAYKTGGDLDQYQMASHVLKFTLLFKTN
jgi:hypothetical protein